MNFVLRTILRDHGFIIGPKDKEHKVTSDGFIQIETEQVLSRNSAIEIIFPNGVKIITIASTSCNDLNRMVSCL